MSEGTQAHTTRSSLPVTDLSEVKAFILAGGLGTRLRSVLPDTPKGLAKVVERPFLDYILEKLAQSGIQKVVICVGYKADQIQEHYGETFGGLSLEYSLEHTPLGTGGALANAASYMSDEPVLIMNGDSYCEVDLEEFYSWHRQINASASLILSSVEDTARYGRIELDENSRITSFIEKGESGGSGWINAGTYLLHPNIIRDIPTGRSVSLEKEVFPTIIGKDFYGFQNREGTFIDIGTPESLKQAQSVFNKEVP